MLGSFSYPNRRKAAGFTLVELMVALVIGLVVTGAVIALILSIMQSNSQTILSTRLSQELRATAAVVVSEVKRANGVADPLAEAKLAVKKFAQVQGQDLVAAPSTWGCIRYGYVRDVAGTPTESYRAISLDDGKVRLSVDENGNGVDESTCDGGTQISSDQVTIETMTFTVQGRRIDLVLEGALTTANPGMAEVRRQITQTIFIRSVPG